MPVHPGDVSSCLPPLPPPVTKDELRLKWIDDITAAETINLKSCLDQIPEFIGPKNIHEQKGLSLPPRNSKIQQKLNELHDFTATCQMNINSKKTKIQPFNFSKRYDFLPQLSIENETLEVVYSTRLLGIIFSSSCKWDDHVAFLVEKAKHKIWTIRRLKSQGACTKTLIEIYKLFIRSSLEFAAPLWTFGLSKKNIDQLEKIQSQITDLILGYNKLSYLERLRDLNLQSPEQRRLNLSKSFSDKMIKDQRFKYLFPQKAYSATRSHERFVAPFCRTNRFKNSAIPKFIEYQNSKAQPQK